MPLFKLIYFKSHRPKVNECTIDNNSFNLSSYLNGVRISVTKRRLYYEHKLSYYSLGG